MGSDGTKNGSKIDEKCVFPKMILDHLGCLNKWNEPFLSPLQAIVATPKSQNALKNQSNMDSKMGFSKDTFGLFGVHKQVE